MCSTAVDLLEVVSFNQHASSSYYSGPITFIFLFYITESNIILKVSISYLSVYRASIARCLVTAAHLLHLV